jgi:hypothetical protein
MTQAVNPVSKYKKHASSAFQLPLLNDAMTCFIVDLCAVHSAQKKAANMYAPFEDAYGLAALPVQTCFQGCPVRTVARTMIRATYVPVSRDGSRSSEIK